MAKFIDFDSIIKTDWTKPSIQKRPLWTIATVGVVLSLIALFVKWITIDSSIKVMGDETTTSLSSGAFDYTAGIVIVIGIVLAVYGLLYRQYGVATIAGLLIFGFSFSFMVDAMANTATIVKDGETYTLQELSDRVKHYVEMLRHDYGRNNVTHFTEIGGLGSFFAVIGGFLTALCSFLLYKKSNK